MSTHYVFDRQSVCEQRELWLWVVDLWKDLLGISDRSLKLPLFFTYTFRFCTACLHWA